MSSSEQLERMRAQVSSIRKRAQEQGKAYMRTGVMAIGGGLIGMAEKKYGLDGAFGMSPALAVGIVGHLGALLDIGGEDTRDALMAGGDAGLTIYSYQQGFELVDGPEGDAAHP